MLYALTLTVDPLTAALGFAHLQAEIAPASPRPQGWSLYLSPSLRLYDGLLGDDGGSFRGIGLEAGLRWFPKEAAPTGPWLMWRGVGAAVYGAERREIAPGGYTSALVGYTAILGPGDGSGLTLSGGAGISWFSYDAPGVEGLHGFLPALHTNVGWAFGAGKAR